MGTIKQDRKDLEALLNGIAPIGNNIFGGSNNTSPQVSGVQTTQMQQTPKNVVDTAPTNQFQPEELFNIDFESTRKGTRKKARKTIMNMAKHILTDDLLEEDYIKDKIEQDIENLTDLYMQVEVNKIMQRSIVETVARGNTMPRMYEVFAQLTDKIQAINKQIISTETQIRKTYIDLKFEIRDKQAEMMDMMPENNKNVLTNNSNANIITSSKDLIAMAKEKHKEKLKNSKETEFVEEDG